MDGPPTAKWTKIFLRRGACLWRATEMASKGRREVVAAVASALVAAE